MRPGPAATPPGAVAAAAGAPLPPPAVAENESVTLRLCDTNEYVPRAQLQRAEEAHDWRVSHGAGRDWVLRELYPAIRGE
eukprot:gene11756-1767_t